MFLGRDHRRDLIKIAAKFLKRRANCGHAQLRHWFCLDDVTLSILRAGACAERERADVFLVFAHQQILDFGSAPDRQEKQPGCDWVEGSAMTDLFYSELTTRDRDDVVRSHAFGFVHQKDAVRSCDRRHHELPPEFSFPLRRACRERARRRREHVRRRQIFRRSRRRSPFRFLNAC